jgi:hypothetical protein
MPSPSYLTLPSPFFAALSISTSSGADSARRASSYTSLESFPFLNFLKACSSAAMSSHSPWNFLYLGEEDDGDGKEEDGEDGEKDGD